MIEKMIEKMIRKQVEFFFLKTARAGQRASLSWPKLAQDSPRKSKKSFKKHQTTGREVSLTLCNMCRSGPDGFETNLAFTIL
jgi:hypothetical protein